MHEALEAVVLFCRGCDLMQHMACIKMVAALLAFVMDGSRSAVANFGYHRSRVESGSWSLDPVQALWTPRMDNKGYCCSMCKKIRF